MDEEDAGEDGGEEEDDCEDKDAGDEEDDGDKEDEEDAGDYDKEDDDEAEEDWSADVFAICRGAPPPCTPRGAAFGGFEAAPRGVQGGGAPLRIANTSIDQSPS